MAASSVKRAVRTLHYVFKVADRTSTIAFYRDVLGMKVTKQIQFDTVFCFVEVQPKRLV